MSRSLRLLLVDSDDDVAFLMRKSLERGGHQVATCATAEEALLAVRQANFDLMALEKILPDMDGLDLLKAMRHEGVRTPAIMVTSHNDLAFISQWLRAGTMDFVIKDRALAFLAELPDRVATAAREADTVVIQPPALSAPRSGAGDCDADAVTSDPLTGLPRRAALQTLLKESWDTSRRSSQPLSLLALDLDHFGRLNAQCLMPGGDQLLVAVARLLSSLARPGHLLFRDGGDQFTFILPGADVEEAFGEAERFRLAVASASLKVWFGGSAEAVAVTVSVGVATLTPADTDAWQLFLRAREAVHRAKGAGRNRSIAAECNGAQYRDRLADTVVIQPPTLPDAAPPVEEVEDGTEPGSFATSHGTWKLLNVNFLFSFIRRWKARRLVVARLRHYRDVMDQVRDDR